MSHPPLHASIVFGLALAGAVAFACHRQWTAALLAAAAPGVGMVAVVALDLLLHPLLALQPRLATGGGRIAAALSWMLPALAGRALLVAYTAAMVIGLLRVPGPPRWLALVTGLALACAPFVWITGTATGPLRGQRPAAAAGTLLLAWLVLPRAWSMGAPVALAVLGALALLPWRAMRADAAARLRALMFRQVL